MNTNIILFVGYYNINCVNTYVYVSCSAVEKIRTDFIETFYTPNSYESRGTSNNKFIWNALKWIADINIEFIDCVQLYI